MRTRLRLSRHITRQSVPVKLEQIEGTPTPPTPNNVIYSRVMAHCPRRMVALDIGAYHGEWTRLMAKDFRWVHAWEVRPQNRVILREKLPGNATLHHCGLSVAVGNERFILRKGYAQSEALGRSGVMEQHRVLPLDAYEFQDPVDLIKLDVDGGERNVIYGAVKTFEQHKPLLCIETKFLNDWGKSDLKKRIGYKLLERVSEIDEVWVASDKP